MADTLSANKQKPLQVVDLQGFFAFRSVVGYHMWIPHVVPSRGHALTATVFTVVSLLNEAMRRGLLVRTRPVARRRRSIRARLGGRSSRAEATCPLANVLGLRRGQEGRRWGSGYWWFARWGPSGQ